MVKGMKSDELTTLSDSFEEDERRVFDELPRNHEGLEQLLDHLRAFDSLQAWCFLFEEYPELLTDTQLDELKDQAQALFDEESLSILLPHIFPPAD